MEVSRQQLIHYANVICHSQAGRSPAEIAAMADLPESLITAWINNWREHDVREAA